MFRALPFKRLLPTTQEPLLSVSSGRIRGLKGCFEAFGSCLRALTPHYLFPEVYTLNGS